MHTWASSQAWQAILKGHTLYRVVQKTVKMWSVENEVDAQVEAEVEEEGNAVAPIPRSTTVDVKPISTFIGQYAFNAVDHHRRKDWFATSAINIDLWSHERSDPIQSFTWGADTIQTCRFNPVEVNLLASAASDRNVVLYDVRTRTPVRKIVLGMMTNAIAWNPLEGMVFAIANEDHNCYTFDMRHLNHALSIHKDHVAAVMSLDFSPTGQEFVTGSYDKTLRVFPVNEGHSREVYHAKRMQRIYSVKFSGDAKYVLSGSDDTNIRLWKARAAVFAGVAATRASCNELSEQIEREVQTRSRNKTHRKASARAAAD